MTGIMAAMAGAGGIGGVVSISDQNPQSVVPDPSIATAVYELANDGTVTSSGEVVGNYCAPTSIASLLEARMTVLSGSIAGSATGSWLSLATTCAWYIQQSGVGINGASGTIEIRESTTGLVRDSATITFYAEAFA